MASSSGASQQRAGAAITLLPLQRDEHAELLQAVYRAAPDYWELYSLSGAPEGQALHDLSAALETPGRTIMGILRPTVTSSNGHEGDRARDPIEMVGMLDIRMRYPGDGMVSIGMIMVAEECRRQGIARAAWGLMEEWLASSAGMRTARLGVEQFNPGALAFFRSLGFELTGQAARHRVGDQFVRLLYMEKQIG